MSNDFFSYGVMGYLIYKIFTAPINSPILLVVSIAYATVESIRIYDARLIQANTKGSYSRVASEADGRSLPHWVGYIHFAGWVLFVVILVLDWMYAIALYVVLFILRVLPVLERIGALIMRTFLQVEPGDVEMELSQSRDELSRSRQEIEENIHKGTKSKISFRHLQHGGLGRGIKRLIWRKP